MSRNIASKKGQEIAAEQSRTSSRVVYRYVDEISARCSGEKFLKSTSRPWRGKVSTSHLRVFLPPRTTTTKVCLWINFVAHHRVYLPFIITFPPSLAFLASRTASAKTRFSWEIYIEKRHLAFLRDILWSPINLIGEKYKVLELCIFMSHFSNFFLLYFIWILLFINNTS